MECHQNIAAEALIHLHKLGDIDIGYNHLMIMPAVFSEMPNLRRIITTGNYKRDVICKPPENSEQDSMGVEDVDEKEHKTQQPHERRTVDAAKPSSVKDKEQLSSGPEKVIVPKVAGRDKIDPAATSKSARTNGELVSPTDKAATRGADANKGPKDETKNPSSAATASVDGATEDASNTATEHTANTAKEDIVDAEKEDTAGTATEDTQTEKEDTSIQVPIYC